MAQSVKRLSLAQVMISGSWDQVPHRALYSAVSLLLPLPPPYSCFLSLPLPLPPPHPPTFFLSLKKKKKEFIIHLEFHLTNTEMFILFS